MICIENKKEKKKETDEARSISMSAVSRRKKVMNMDREVANAEDKVFLVK